MAEGNGHNPTQVATNSIVRLEILLDRTTGSVTVNGPVDDAVFCYGLLECAKQSIQHYIAQKSSGSRIVPANMLPLLRH